MFSREKSRGVMVTSIARHIASFAAGAILLCLFDLSGDISIEESISVDKTYAHSIQRIDVEESINKQNNGTSAPRQTVDQPSNVTSKQREETADPNTTGFSFPSPDERLDLFQFPSVDERVRYYMGSWMNVASVNTSDLLPQYCNHDFSTGPTNPGPIILGLNQIAKCVHAMISPYCKDALPMLVDPTTYTMRTPTYQLMVMIRPGDHSDNLKNLPVVAKAREVRDEAGDANILWPFNVKRHYKHLFDESNHLQGIPWEDKKDTLIWRGSATGNRVNIVQMWFDHNPQDIDVALNSIPGFKKSAENINKAKELIRNGHNISEVLQEIGVRVHMTSSNDPENVVKALELTRDTLAPSDMVKYKYLLSLEGNDVATGLKWMLWSNSVVLMARPTKASWAMEDKLQPFVHYIPIDDDHSNVDEMLEWARRNQDESQRISAQATHFMDDLVMSEKAQGTNDEIMKRMSIMYQQRFGKTLYQYCHKNDFLVSDDNKLDFNV